jgi:kynurenine formamidase
MEPVGRGLPPLEEITAALQSGYQVVDLSQPFVEGMPTYPTHSKYFHNLWESYWHGDVAVAYQLTLSEHTGTHVDAPAHFVRDDEAAQIWVDEMPVTSLIGRAARVDVVDRAAEGTFGPEVLDEFEVEHGPLRKGDIVLFRTGWDRHWAPRPEGERYLHGWPGPDDVLATSLRDRGVRAVGIDTLGLDADGTATFPAHRILLGAGVPIMENLRGLERLPAFSLLMAFPLRIDRGSGSPIRPVAFLPPRAE